MEKLKTKLETFTDGLDTYVDKVKKMLKAELGEKRKVVIFGAGEKGQRLYKELSQDEDVVVVAFVDNFMRGKVFGFDILRPEQLIPMEFDCIHIASSAEARKVIILDLLDIGIGLNKIEAPLFEKLLIIMKRPLQLLRNSLETRVLKNTFRRIRTGVDIGYPKFTKESARLCKSNFMFKDIHAGERCFILGNGPSLQNVDLSLLADEFVFTCNFFSEVKDYKKAKTNVHAWTDPYFFGLLNDRKRKCDEERIWANYRAIAEESPICFVPARFHDFIFKNGLDRLLNINYLSISTPVLPMKSQDYSYDLCAPSSCGISVVQDALINTALYMGFKEIYLLGCDETVIIPCINALLEENIACGHAYDERIETSPIMEVMRSASSSSMMWWQYVLFLTYKKINELCMKKNVKLINCSSKTLITDIPRMDLSEVLGQWGAKNKVVQNMGRRCLSMEPLMPKL